MFLIIPYYDCRVVVPRLLIIVHYTFQEETNGIYETSSIHTKITS